jgi:3-hydroxybutyryl-CoA dehydrogenase
MAAGLPAACERVAVIGNGIIGHGVAQVFAVAGRDVVLVGRADASLARALERVRASLADFTRHGLVTAEEADAAVGRIRTTTRLEDAGGADLVIEAVTEDLPLKHGIFAELERSCPAPAVLGSSSGQPASALVARMSDPSRVIATHFWYPPQLLPLVEVCAGPQTAAGILGWTCDALRAAGKEPVVIDRELPGFIGNRIQFAMLREAWALWASGAASAEAIDAVVRNSVGRRLGITGPIESADVGGLDTMHAFASFLQPHLDAEPDPPAAIGDLVAAGHRGLPSGRGVYDWGARDGDALLRARMDELFRWLAVDRGTS